jgi:hypothetical protein
MKNDKDYKLISSGGDLWGDNSVRWDHQENPPLWCKILIVGGIVTFFGLIGLLGILIL